MIVTDSTVNGTVLGQADTESAALTILLGWAEESGHEVNSVKVAKVLLMRPLDGERVHEAWIPEC